MTDSLIELLYSPNPDNVQVGIELLRRQERLLRETDMVRALVLLCRLLPNEQQRAELQVLLRSYADRRTVALCEQGLGVLDTVLQRRRVAWLVFEQSWFVYQRLRPLYDPLLLLNPLYAQTVYETIGIYLVDFFQKQETGFQLLAFLQERDLLSAKGEECYSFLLVHHFFPLGQKLELLDQAARSLERAAAGRLRSREVFLHAIGKLYAEYRQDPEAALPYFERAIEVNPQHAPSHYELALYHLNQTDQTEKAKEHIQQALSADPENPSYRLAQWQFRLEAEGNPTAAGKLLSALLDDLPYDAKIRLHAARRLMHVQKWEAAETLLLQALDLQPKSEETLSLLCQICSLAAQYNRLEIYAKRILFLNPRHGQAQTWLQEALSN